MMIPRSCYDTEIRNKHLQGRWVYASVARLNNCLCFQCVQERDRPRRSTAHESDINTRFTRPTAKETEETQKLISIHDFIWSNDHSLTRRMLKN